MPAVAAWSALVAAIHADPILANAGLPIAPAPNTAIPAFIGESGRAQRLTPPYVVWLPATRDRYVTELAPQVRPLSAAGAQPRWICTRWVGSLAHLHCLQQNPGDFDTMELTVNAFIAALHRTARGSYHLGAGYLEPTHGTELTKDRKVYLLEVELATPITEVPSEATTATVTSAPVTAGVSNPTNPPK